MERRLGCIELLLEELQQELDVSVGVTGDYLGACRSLPQEAAAPDQVVNREGEACGAGSSPPVAGAVGVPGWPERRADHAVSRSADPAGRGVVRDGRAP